MPTTWIEIVDTAVKIGLGAVVTGIATSVNNSQSHTRSLQKDKLAKNVEMLERVTLSIEEVTHTLLKHWAHIVEWAKINERGDEVSEEKAKLITEYRTELFHLFKGLTNSEGMLLLLGYTKQQRKLREYGALIAEYHRYASRNNELIRASELEAWRVKILDGREGLYRVLNRAYRNEA